MPFIEVYDPAEHSFYRGELHGVTGKYASVIFEGADEPTKVETNFIRPEPAPAPEGFTPQLHSSVEVRFQMEGQAPSHWEGTVYKIIDGKALVKFPNPNYNDVYEFNVLRPATGLVVGESVFELLPVPVDCHDDFMEHNQPAVQYVLTTSRLVSLCFVPAKRSLALYGLPAAVTEAKSLLSIVFARSKLLNQAMKKSAGVRGRGSHQPMETFTIPTSMVGFALGKGGKNVNEVKRSLGLQDVTFDPVPDDESKTRVSIFADSKEKGELAKRQLHYVEQVVEIQDRNHIRSIIGQQGSAIRDLKEQTQVPNIIVKDKENPAQIVIQGLKDGVDKCAKMIAIICLYDPEEFPQGGGAARSGSQRFQNFQDRQQRAHMQPRDHLSSDDFPALSSAQPGGKQKQKASGASAAASASSARPVAAAPVLPSKSSQAHVAAAPAPADAASAPAEEAAPTPRSARGGRGGRVHRGGNSRAEDESADVLVPPQSRGGQLRRRGEK
jgi:hypothetical protein